MGKGSSRTGLKGGHVATAPIIQKQSSLCECDQDDDSYLHRPSLLASCGDDSYEEPFTPKGLANIGNSCYANATLQCLLSTALTHALTDPTASAIFRRYSSNINILAQGSGSVDSEDDCCTTTTDTSASLASSVLKRRQARLERKLQERIAMQQNCQWLTQELRMITQEYNAPEQRQHPASSWLYGAPANAVVDPGVITRNPHRLCSSLRPYQQEDAHEFLRALLGTLVMHGQNKELSSLFDGLLESSVTCQVCYRPSLTRDRYMDLSLNIADPKIETLRDALQEFTSTETLSGENSVFCRHCECKRTATKGLRLATAPSILVCHFKRFAYNEYGRLVRLKKKVTFPKKLEIGGFMSKVNQARPPPYELVAVLVHQGVSCDSGHYLAYVKHDGCWFKCNDAMVEQVDVKIVLAQQAYILMYEVAEMRANNGFSGTPKSLRKNRAAHHASPSNDFLSFTSHMLCGMDYDSTFLSDFCSWGRPRRRPRRSGRKQRRGREHSRDDLSTLGDSTVETSDRSRFRRSSSSGNLREQDGTFRKRSSSVNHRRSSSRPRFSAEQARQHWKASQRGGQLPPRPVHRRASSGCVQ